MDWLRVAGKKWRVKDPKALAFSSGEALRQTRREA